MCKTRVMLTVMLKSFFSCFHHSIPYHIVVITCNIGPFAEMIWSGNSPLKWKTCWIMPATAMQDVRFFFFFWFSLIYLFVEGFNLMWVPLFGPAKLFESQIRTTSCGHAAYMIGYDWIQDSLATSNWKLFHCHTWQTSSRVMWVRQWVHFTRCIIMINFGWEVLKTHSEICNPLPF